MKNNKKQLDKIINTISSLSSCDKDEIYRHLWKEYVKKDVYSRCQEIKEIKKIKDIMINNIVEWVANEYVYECAYDCNLSYWENIDNLIEACLSTYENE